ncbi:hypothetical protein ACFV4Q_03035 [Streptomyces nojiriensis]|uniref:hypothetical protein n=1 Tax=Streptomyces nojiriensis TaxID=66374 RepID=UPI003661B045
MQDHRIRRVPVIADHRLVGMISGAISPDTCPRSRWVTSSRRSARSGQPQRLPRRRYS